MRFAEVIWGVIPEGKTDEQIASEGIDALESWIKEIGAASEITSLGVTPDMLDRIADSTIILTGGYQTLDHAEIVDILRNSL